MSCFYRNGAPPFGLDDSDAPRCGGRRVVSTAEPFQTLLCLPAALRHGKLGFA